MTNALSKQNIRVDVLSRSTVASQKDQAEKALEEAYVAEELAENVVENELEVEK